MHDLHELRAWLRLLETPLIGREAARKLLAAFGSPQAVIEAATRVRSEIVGAAAAAAIERPPEGLEARVEATWAWLQIDDESAPRALIALGDPRYPRALLDTADPPLMIYARGRIELLQASAIAVVGSRNPTPQGADNAREFARHLSRAGLTVVSGLALGIDAAAHAGALDGGAGTIAVVGTGMDSVYPRRHRELARRIAADGVMLSEYALGTPPLAANFPQRNRIIAGLCVGTLVVEAALQSGSLITARLANEAGRDVFAIPGSIHSPQSRGCHALIKQGAKLVETAQDILEELRVVAIRAAPVAAEASSSTSMDDDGLLEALGFDPVTLDALAARTGRAAAVLSSRLLELEFDGRVTRLPGQMFQRVTPR